MTFSKPVATTLYAAASYFTVREMQRTGHMADRVKIAMLCYYAYAWYLVGTENKEQLFPGPPVAAPVGPWFPEFDDVWSRIVDGVALCFRMDPSALADDHYQTNRTAQR